MRLNIEVLGFLFALGYECPIVPVRFAEKANLPPGVTTYIQNRLGAPVGVCLRILCSVSLIYLSLHQCDIVLT